MFQGPVKNLKKPVLLELAQALSLPISSSALKPDIVNLIDAHLAANPRLCEDPRFQGLSAYRPDKAEAKKYAKKSTDKALEDAQASKTDSNSTTGANQTLYQMNYRSDPAPSHVHLRSGSGERPTQQLEPKNGSPENSSESRNSSLTPPPVSGDSQEPELPLDIYSSYVQDQNTNFDLNHDKPIGQAPEILVRLFEDMKDQSQAKEIWILTKNGIDIDESSGKHGSVSLSQVVPEVLQTHSPIKGADGRLFRRGVANKDQKVNLGSLDSLFKAKEISFPMKIVDNYELDMDKKGHLFCDLFIESDPKTPVNPPPASSSFSFVDSFESDMAPLARARERNIKKEARLAAHKVTKEDLHFFLRHEFEITKTYQSKAKTMIEVVVRQEALASLTKALDDRDWGVPKGGYEIKDIERPPPDDYDGEDWSRFIGCAIHKIDITDVLGLGSSQTAGDARRLTASTLANAPDALEWVRDPHGKHHKQFATMSRADFTKYVEKQDQREKQRRSDERKARKRQEKQKSKSKNRKRKHEDSESEVDEPPKKGKKKSRIDSDNLDTPSSSSSSSSESD